MAVQLHFSSILAKTGYCMTSDCLNFNYATKKWFVGLAWTEGSGSAFLDSQTGA
jgi:hypothetical protein